jgi:predicted nucleic acid-binding protein
VATHLADTSAWFVSQRRSASPELRKSFAGRLSSGSIAICGPVTWEILYSTRNAAEYEAVRGDLAALDQVRVMDADWERAMDVCHELARQGGSLHRAPSMPDALVAVTAERASLTVLHYDKDFDLIASVTGQPCEWVVPQGSL